jgi:hypothetical protein
LFGVSGGCTLKWVPMRLALTTHNGSNAYWVVATRAPHRATLVDSDMLSTFDPKTGALTGYAKGRGPGDCGGFAGGA